MTRPALALAPYSRISAPHKRQDVWLLWSNIKSLSYRTPMESANGLISRIAAAKLCEEPGVSVKIYQPLQYRCEA
ncbi:hypothetical protein AVEN_211436-1 [Araneus ventricosus]|uniref:Uncharacterized protein n=1 Tax=Araneus ventricosus TaxID=182803 RepID=A0A4Y2DDI6_ARAVE|nr:hypothetical protein AVEN_211436-1 [Araneus ventricosus]